MSEIVDDQSVHGLRYRASPDAVSSQLGDELALLDFRTNSYFTLNDVGACVWSALQSPVSFGEICERVTSLYDIAPNECREDVRALLTDLSDAGLVDEAHAA